MKIMENIFAILFIVFMGLAMLSVIGYGVMHHKNQKKYCIHTKAEGFEKGDVVVLKSDGNLGLADPKTIHKYYFVGVVEDSGYVTLNGFVRNIDTSHLK